MLYRNFFKTANVNKNRLQADDSNGSNSGSGSKQWFILLIVSQKAEIKGNGICVTS